MQAPSADVFVQHAVDAFARTIALKLELLRTYIPKNTNSELTGNYVEELVRGFIRGWIGHRLLLHGTFHPTVGDEDTVPSQIDGILYDPTQGPAILREGDFVVVHPIFCDGLIEIKTSLCTPTPSAAKLHEALEKKYKAFFHGRIYHSVIGVVVTDNDPEKHSIDPRSTLEVPIYRYQAGIGGHPIFILFKEADGVYTPHFPAIRALIRHCYRDLRSDYRPPL